MTDRDDPRIDEERLSELYARVLGFPPARVDPLRAHGSDRRIYRILGGGRSIVGVVNADRAENAAFVSFSRHFRTNNLPVPEILGVSRDETAYLEEDLGDHTLFELLTRARAAGASEVPAEVARVYEKVVRWLPAFQVRAGRGIDERVCYPRSRFDRQSMTWDLSYFKYYFLKLAQIPFHEQALENDFQALVDFLLQAPSEFFLYRDFQSRNVMVRDGEPWFIDYQGGRRGALHYDLASLLVDAKANLPLEFRERMIGLYLEALEGEGVAIDRAEFMRHYDGFMLIRILQAMGAYGFRGFYERKTHFLQSVPYAIRNLEILLTGSRLPLKLPALFGALQAIVRSTRLREMNTATAPLTVRVESFSYKKGLPADESGHGGGFVFDCRVLPNPGRDPDYASYAGDDPEIVRWLEAHEDVHTFLARVRDIIGQVVDGYRRRGFTHLSVAFGCTGGQHRSVYCATQLAKHLGATAGLNAELRHRDVVRAARDAKPA